MTEVDHTGISHLLHDGFVPQPRTIYRDIFVISTGFSAQLVDGEIRFRYDFPFAKRKSLQDQVPDAGTLLSLLAQATENACRQSDDALLLLSAGLDSSSIALAAKAAGRDDLQCVTYAEIGHHEEAEFARRLCIRLGLRHETFVLDIKSQSLVATLLQYASMAPEPCGDPALIACVAPLGAHSRAGMTVLDGSGSDSYFWKPPRNLDLIKLRLGLSRIPAIRRFRGIVPMHLRYERLLSTPLEPMLFSGPRLRHHDTRLFYSQSVDTHQFWLDQLSRSTYPTDEVRSAVRSTFLGPGAHMLKTRNAALASGGRAKFPWADPAVAAYCFHLPERDRFDRRSGQAKIIVREMLRKYVAYEDEVIGKRVFSFGKRAFISQHMAFIREQILACTLWSRQIEPYFEGLKTHFLRGHKTENALLDLLMVSLWHTHWFMRRMLPPAERHMARSVAA